MLAKKSVIFLLAIISMILCAFSADQPFSISSYSCEVWQQERGLPQNAVNGISQDQAGYLWLPTYGGLARFDGITFAIFDQTNLPGLSSNRIISFLKSSSGDLWIGTEKSGLNHIHAGQCTTFSRANGFPADIINTIAEDKQQRIWVGTESGMFCFANKTPPAYTKHDELPAGTVTKLIAAQDGTLWICANYGLYSLKNDILSLVWQDDKLKKYGVSSVACERTRRVWIGTKNGLYALDHGKISSFSKKELPNQIIHSLQLDRYDNLWIGTVSGLVVFNHGTFSPLALQNGSSDCTINSLYEDWEGNIWVGTDGNGLNCLRRKKITPLAEEFGLPGKSVVPIVADGANGFWVGATADDDLCHYHDGRVEHFPKTTQYFPDNGIWALCVDRSHTVWYGSWGGGIGRIVNGRREVVSEFKLSSNIVFAIFQDRQGAMWFGTDKGLACWSEGKLRSYKTSDGLVHNEVRRIMQDSQGNLWIGTLGGISQFHQGRFKNYTLQDGLSNLYVREIYEDTEHTIWIGTYGGGLNRLRDGHFSRFNSKSGLPDNTVSRILEDDNGYLWLTGNRGITRVSRHELNAAADGKTRTYACVEYGMIDGMKTSECNGGGQTAGCRGNDGMFYFPTNRGVAMLDPMRINTVVPKIILENVNADMQSYSPSGAMVFPAGTQRLEFQYTAIAYSAPEKVHFRLKIDGFDRSWIEAGTKHSAYYTNLSPGAYTFRLNACNNDGIWNPTGLAWHFRILPYFYQTVWFYMACIVLGGFFVFLAFEWRVRQMRKRERQLEKVVALRTSELAYVNQALEEQAVELEITNQQLQENAQELEVANSQLGEVNKKLETLSNLDGLTGIANRRYFEQFADLEWRRAIREQKEIAFMMIDVDFFKKFNDAYGHQQGDECLKKIAHALSMINRPGDMIARYGGEEFVAVLGNTDILGAVHVAQQMHRQVETLQIQHAYSDVSNHVTISIGVAAGAPVAGSTHTIMIATADQALYKAKSLGRNRFYVHDAEPIPAEEAIK